MCSVIFVAFLLVFIIIPTLFRTPDVRVPDVSGLTVRKATEELEKKGLVVSSTVKEDYTDEFKKGIVSKTSPKARETVKKGATITLYKSLGSDKIQIEDYTNQDFNKVKAELEVKGLSVTTDYKVVEDKSKYKGKENLIIDQSVEKGKTLVRGDSITLYLPKILKEYPDFVKEKYKLSEVQDFCKEYDIKLEVEEKEDGSVAEGTIIAQSRAAGSEIAERATRKITVAKKPKEEEKKSDEGMVPYTNEDTNNEG